MDERSTFGSLLEPLIPKLRRYARALTRDPVRADDLVQDTLARALVKQGRYEPGTDLQAWLLSLMHNINVDQIRAHERRRLAIFPINEGRARDDPSMSMVLRDLHRALGRLPPERRRAIMLCGYRGLPYVDAAEIEGVPVGTLASRLARGREELRALMEG